MLLDALDGAGDGRLDVAAAWAAIETVASREQVLGAVATVQELVPDDESGEAAMREMLAGTYGVVRPFLELLAEAMPLHAAAVGAALLGEVRRLPELARRRVAQRPLRPGEITTELVAPSWRRAVFATGLVHRCGGPRRLRAVPPGGAAAGAAPPGGIFAAPSSQWADPPASSSTALIGLACATTS